MDRLSELKEGKFLNQRIFPRISENMHYEIFQYLGPKALLQIRAMSTGGYQLTSNQLLRSRIKNYFPKLKFNLNQKLGKLSILFHPKTGIIYSSIIEENIEININKLRKRQILLIFGQIGKEFLDLTGMNLGKTGNKQLIQIIRLLQDIPEIKGINLCTHLALI